MLNDLGNYSTSGAPECIFLQELLLLSCSQPPRLLPRPPAPPTCEWGGPAVWCMRQLLFGLWSWLPWDFLAAQHPCLCPALLPFALCLFQTLRFLTQSLLPVPLSAYDLVFSFFGKAKPENTQQQSSVGERWVEARDAAKHPTTHRTASPDEKLPGPKYPWCPACARPTRRPWPSSLHYPFISVHYSCFVERWFSFWGIRFEQFQDTLRSWWEQG